MVYEPILFSLKQLQLSHGYSLSLTTSCLLDSDRQREESHVTADYTQSSFISAWQTSHAPPPPRGGGGGNGGEVPGEGKMWSRFGLISCGSYYVVMVGSYAIGFHFFLIISKNIWPNISFNVLRNPTAACAILSPCHLMICVWGAHLYPSGGSRVLYCPLYL